MVDSLLATATAKALIASTGDCIPSEPTNAPSVAPSLTFSDESDDAEEPARTEKPRQRRASTRLIAQSARDIQRITGETTAEFVGRCCGGGCCLMGTKRPDGVDYVPLVLPDNAAFNSLGLKFPDEVPTKLTGIVDMPTKVVSFKSIPRPLSNRSLQASDSGISMCPDGEASSTTSAAEKAFESMAIGSLDTAIQPPKFVQPHPPYHVYPAKIHTTRELTKEGAEKRTYHFDLDITNYPDEETNDFKVGGAIGVLAPNDDDVVDDVLDRLMVPRFVRDKQTLITTTTGRWPTVWGDEKPASLLLPAVMFSSGAPTSNHTLPPRPCSVSSPSTQLMRPRRRFSCTSAPLRVRVRSAIFAQDPMLPCLSFCTPSPARSHLWTSFCLFCSSSCLVSTLFPTTPTTLTRRVTRSSTA